MIRFGKKKKKKDVRVKKKDADYDSLSIEKKDAWLKQLESFFMFLQEFLLRQFLLLIKKMLRLEVSSRLVRLYSHSHSEFFKPPFLITSPLQNRRRIRPRHRLRHNNLRLDIRRALQPGNNHLFRNLARFPLAQSSLLHFQSNLRSIHSRYTHDGHVSPTTVRI